MINLNGELVTSIPSVCKNYDPKKDEPTNVRCEKIGDLYKCKNQSYGAMLCAGCANINIQK